MSDPDWVPAALTAQKAVTLVRSAGYAAMSFYGFPIQRSCFAALALKGIILFYVPRYAETDWYFATEPILLAVLSLAVLECWWREWPPLRLPALSRQTILAGALWSITLLLPEANSIAWSFDRHRQQFFLGMAAFVAIATADRWRVGIKLTRAWGFWCLYCAANVLSRLPQFQAWETLDARWAGYFLSNAIHNALIFCALLVVRPWRRL